MSLKKCIYFIVLGTSFFGWNVGASALCNNVYIVSDHADERIADSWLNTTLPKMPEHKSQATFSKPIQPPPANVSGDIQFSPVPGASFQTGEDSFTKYREAFRSD